MSFLYKNKNILSTFNLDGLYSPPNINIYTYILSPSYSYKHTHTQEYSAI